MLKLMRFTEDFLFVLIDFVAFFVGCLLAVLFLYPLNC